MDNFLRLALPDADIRTASLAVLIGCTDDPPPHPVDALYDSVSLSDVAQGEQNSDPYGALTDAGIDGYTGLDTVLSGSHDHSLMLTGFAMMENDDES